MNGFASFALLPLLLLGIANPPEPSAIESLQAESDVPLALDAALPFWRDARLVTMENDRFGKTVPHFRTEVRTRWTKNNLYFLFTCPYEELYLKSNPNTHQETYELWNSDVAEAFIGSDFDVIQRYKEFEVSPQGEWVDLDIDLRKPHHEDGWKWNSHFESAARIDKTNHVWYAAMRIPFSAIDTRPATAGNTLRINLFLSEGPPSSHREIAWQATMNESFHVPERFGLIRLVNK
jgi:Carbohydrate family 9 binding domain-like